MLILFATIDGHKEVLRRFEDHGIGRNALIKFATSEFYNEKSLAQRSADVTQAPVKIELYDMDKEEVLEHLTCRPAESIPSDYF